MTLLCSLYLYEVFDKLEESRGKEIGVDPRIESMIYYLSIVSEPKKRLTLQNFNGLLEKGLIPDELSYQKKVFAFNKWLRKNKTFINKDIFVINQPKALQFYQQNFDVDKLNVQNNITYIYKKDWENQYKVVMDDAR